MISPSKIRAGSAFSWLGAAANKHRHGADQHAGSIRHLEDTPKTRSAKDANAREHFLNRDSGKRLFRKQLVHYFSSVIF